jgi:hypothetical protein
MWMTALAMDIAFTKRKEDPGSNPGIMFFIENIAMLLCVFDLKCVVSVFT